MTPNYWLLENKLFTDGTKFFVPDPDNPECGIELVPKSKIPLAVRAWLFAWSFAAVGLLGAGINALLSNNFGSNNSGPVELTTEQKTWPALVQSTWPIDIELQIVSREEFDRRKPAPNVVAFAHPTRRPCRIVMPAGDKIEFSPARKFAVWNNRETGDTLAHEILHCLRGSWHP